MSKIIVMEEYQSSNRLVQVKGAVILDFINSQSSKIEERIKLLEMYGIKDIDPKKWYSQQSWLNALKKSIAGPMSAKIISQRIVSNLTFPEEITNLEQAIFALDQAYQMNHRKGYVGYYKMLKCNIDERNIIFDVNTPYPNSFDSGVLLQLWRCFKPNAVVAQVEGKYDKSSSGTTMHTLTW